MPKRLFIILYLAISFVVASHAQQHDKDDIIISLSDSTKIHGTLLKSWFTPGKLNREFLMKLSDGSEKWFNSSDVDSIEFKHNKDKWAAHDIIR